MQSKSGTLCARRLGTRVLAGGDLNANSPTRDEKQLEPHGGHTLGIECKGMGCKAFQ